MDVDPAFAQNRGTLEGQQPPTLAVRVYADAVGFPQLVLDAIQSRLFDHLTRGPSTLGVVHPEHHLGGDALRIGGGERPRAVHQPDFGREIVAAFSDRLHFVVEPEARHVPDPHWKARIGALAAAPRLPTEFNLRISEHRGVESRPNPSPAVLGVSAELSLEQALLT